MTLSPAPQEGPELAADASLADRLEALRAPFPPEVVGKLFKAFQKQPPNGPKANCSICGSYHSTAAGIHLDYVGHAAVYKRLLLVDPEWSWKPMGRAPDGTPAMTLNGDLVPMRLWIELTVCGVTRIGVGSVDSGAFDAEKQLVGDAVRNAAKGFGVALDLWSKDELESAVGEVDAPAARPSKAPKDTRPAAEKKLSAQVNTQMVQGGAPGAGLSKEQQAEADDVFGRPAPQAAQEGAGSTQKKDGSRTVLGFTLQTTWNQARVELIGERAAKSGPYPPVPDLAKKTWDWASQGEASGLREAWLTHLLNAARTQVTKDPQVTLLWDLQRAVLAYNAMIDRLNPPPTAPITEGEA